MGARGPRPKSGALGDARHRSLLLHLPDAARLAGPKRAEKLEQVATRLLGGVRAATARTKNNGVQIHPKLAAALRLFEAADRIWQRLGRATPSGSSPRAATESKWDGLL